MGLALKVYDVFRDEKEKATILAEVIEAIEMAMPHKDDLVTNTVLTERTMELKLEIEKTRKEIKEVEGNLTLEIEKTRKEIKEVEGHLSLEIEKSRNEMLKYMNRQTLWVISAVSVIIGALKGLDYLLK